MSYFFWPSESHGIDQFGSKGVTLSNLEKAGFETPAWFVIAPESFYSSMSETEYESIMYAAEQTKLPKLNLSFQLSQSLDHDLTKALKVLCPKRERIAVRASPVESEWAGDNTRGLLGNFLFVATDDVSRAVGEVWKSAFAQEVLHSRLRKSLPPVPKAPAVVIQRMLNPESAGTAYSADPDSGKRTVCVIRSVFGLSTAMISKDCTSDQFVVSRDGKILSRDIQEKTIVHECEHAGLNGIEHVDLPPEKASQPSLTDAQIQEVAAMVRKAAKCFGKPQVVEWAIENGKLYVLQTNPIIELKDKPDPDAEISLWSGRPLGEDYPGVLTPLTYSLAAHLYRLRTRTLCRSLGMPNSQMKRLDLALSRLSGMIHGRFYVDLIELHRIASLVASKSCRRDAELLLGMTEEIPPALIEAAAKESGAIRKHGSMGNYRLSSWLSSMTRWENSRVKRFDSAIKKLLTRGTVRMEDLRPREIVERIDALLEGVEPILATPVSIDAQISLHHERLRRALEDCKLSEAEVARVTGPLLTGLPGFTKTGFIGDLVKLGASVPEEANFASILQQGSTAVVDTALEGRQELVEAIDTFIESHGHRIAGEFKLNTVDFHENKLPFIRLLGLFAIAQKNRLPGETPMSRSAGIAKRRLATLSAEHGKAVRQANHSIDRLKQLFVLRQTCRKAMGDYHAHIRALVTEAGMHLENLGALRHAGDVQYLSIREVKQYILGGGVNSNINTLSASRRREVERLMTSPPPALGFEARGVVNVGSQIPPAGPPNGDKKATEAFFVGGCCGTVQGRAVVVSDPGSDRFISGDILVARETDPGWAFLIASARAVIIENAGPTSFVAVLTRELGIPCVIQAEGATHWLRSGQRVEVNGETGKVTKMARR